MSTELQEEAGILSGEEQRVARAILSDPVQWGERYLTNRNGRPRRWWPHQKEDLRNSNPRIIHRDGRDTGKSVSLIGHLLHYAFTHESGSALVAAPYQGHLDALIDELEFQIDHCDDLYRCLARNRSGQPRIERKPYFQAEFANGTVLYFRPAGVEGAAFRSLHVDRLYVDEAAWLPERAWKALRMCLNAGGLFRVYSTPNGLRDTTYYRLTSSKRWQQVRWPAWVSPRWSKQRERELLDFYGGRGTAGWQHEVAGEHGMPTWCAFNLEQLVRCTIDIPEYLQLSLTGADLAQCGSEAEFRTELEMLMNLVPHEGIYWLGGDLGYTADPTELVLFREEDEVLRLVLRVHAEHVAYPVVSELIAAIDRAYRPAGIGVDNGGNGLSVVQELNTLDKYRDHGFGERLHGFDFGGTTIIGYSEDGEPIKKRTKEYMTALINKELNQRRLLFPIDDRELEDQFATHTYSRSERHIVYAKGNDHIVDAVRCALLVRDRLDFDDGDPNVEEEAFVMPLLTDPVFD